MSNKENIDYYNEYSKALRVILISFCTMNLSNNSDNLLLAKLSFLGLSASSIYAILSYRLYEQQINNLNKGTSKKM